jgi:DnaJ-class molecular chaperone
MYAFNDSYNLERDRNHNRKAKMRAERKNLKSCDRCEGFGTLIAPVGEEICYCCHGFGMVKILVIVK